MITQVHTPDGIEWVDIPDPEADRVLELLANSPAVITMPEIWEVLRLMATRMGYHPPA